MQWNLKSSIAFARSLANSSGVTIEEHEWDGNFKPYTENGRIHISSPSPENIGTYEPELHKCISQAFPALSYMDSLSYEEDSRSSVVHRLLKDYLGEREKLGEYEGRDEILSNHRSSIMSSFDISSVKDDKLKALLHTLTRARNGWQSYVHDDIESSLEKNGFIEELNKCKSAEDLKRLIQLAETTEQEQEDGSQGDDRAGDGSGEEGSGESSNGEANDSEGDSGGGEGEEGGRDGSEEHGVGYTDKDALEGAQILGPVGKKGSSVDSTHYIPASGSKDQEVVMSEAKTSWYSNELDEVLDGLNLSKKVKRHLLSLSQTSYEYGLKAGKLNPKSLSRLITTPRGVQPRIYKKKNSSRLEVETAVSILCDCSGSMSGECYLYAAASCIATSLILQDLKVNHEIIGFSTGAGGNRYFQFKRYGEPHVSRDKLTRRFLSSNLSMNCKSDGEALTYCMEHLLMRKEKNKVLLVLSDGSPAGSGRGCSHTYLQKIAKAIEMEGQVNLAAIGISTSVVERYYSNYQVVNKLEDLEPAILEVMSKNIIR